MWTIGQLSQATGLDRHTLRFYEKIGLLPRPSRGGNGYRQYSEEDLSRLEFIKKAKSLGFSLTEISHILDLREKNEVPCDEIRKRLEDKHHDLKRQMDLLADFQSEVERLAGVRAMGINCGCAESHKLFLEKTGHRAP